LDAWAGVGEPPLLRRANVDLPVIRSEGRAVTHVIVPDAAH
jgi:hypothetical protein